jgi:hypothetical protein
MDCHRWLCRARSCSQSDAARHRCSPIRRLEPPRSISDDSKTDALVRAQSRLIRVGSPLHQGGVIQTHEGSSRHDPLAPSAPPSVTVGPRLGECRARYFLPTGARLQLPSSDLPNLRRGHRCVLLPLRRGFDPIARAGFSGSLGYAVLLDESPVLTVREPRHSGCAALLPAPSARSRHPAWRRKMTHCHRPHAAAVRLKRSCARPGPTPARAAGGKHLNTLMRAGIDNIDRGVCICTDRLCIKVGGAQPDPQYRPHRPPLKDYGRQSGKVAGVCCCLA